MKKFIGIGGILLVAFLMTSCGGGNPFSQVHTSSDPSATAEGRAIDGYLSNATVCLDVNENGSCDDDEPQATTKEDGTYSFETSKANLDTYRVVVAVIAGKTVDMDEPDTVLTEAYTLTAPPGQFKNITPITTQVVAKIVENGGTFGDANDLATAISGVKEDLGFADDMDITGDYVAKKKTDSRYQEMHNVAGAVADVLKLVEQDKGEDGGNFLKRLRSAGDNIKTFVKDNVGEIKKQKDRKAARDRMKKLAPMKVELKLSSRDGGSVYVGHKVTVSAKIRSFSKIDKSKLSNSWSVSGSASTSETSDGDLEVTFSSEGEYTVSLTVTNSADGSTVKNSKKIRVIKSVPTKPRILVKLKCPSTETAGRGNCDRDGYVRRPNHERFNFIVNDTVYLEGSSTDPAGGKITYSWDFGDNTTDSGAAVTKSYTAAGEFTVKVTATNPDSNSSESSLTLKVAEMSGGGDTEKPGTPTISGPSSGSPYGELEFSATSDKPNCDGNVRNLMFMWDMGDRSNNMRSRAGEKVKHAYREAGTYTIDVKAYCPATKLTSDAAQAKVTIATTKPGTPVISGPSTGKTGTAVKFTAAVRQSNCTSRHLHFEYDFGDGGRPATDTDNDGIEHTYTKAGDFTVKVKALCPANRQESDQATHNIKITSDAGGGGGGSGTYRISNFPTVSFYGRPVKFSTAAGADSYEWDLGDGSRPVTTREVEHTYREGGNYTVTLKATKGRDVETSTMTQAVIKSCEDKLENACTGPNCKSGAVVGNRAATEFTTTVSSGAGVSLWCYNNTSAREDATIKFTVSSGLTSNHKMTLVFSNPTVDDISGNVPAVGSSPAGNVVEYSPEPVARGELTLNEIAELERQDEENYRRAWHYRHHQREAETQAMEARSPLATAGSPAGYSSYDAPPQKSPSIGASKKWYELTASGCQTAREPDTIANCPYNTKLIKKCQLSSGREVLFWTDDASKTANGGDVSDAEFEDYRAAVCSGSGDKQGFDKLVGLTGDFWLSSPRYRQNIAGDGDRSLSAYNNSLQPFNVIFVKPPGGTGWGGYVWSLNASKKDTGGAYVNSNEALLTFINSTMSSSASGVKYTKSTLIHEVQHALSYASATQRGGYSTATALEEGQAVTSEDIVTPTMCPGYNKVTIGSTSRLANYLKTKGGVSWADWPSLSGDHYNMAGAWGAFMNRMVGTKAFKAAANDCARYTETVGRSTVAFAKCYEHAIQHEGALSFADFFGRLGASVFGNLGTQNLPPWIGFPAQAINSNDRPHGFSFPAVDLTSLSSSLTGSSNISNFDMTSHYYKRFNISGSSLTRTGIKIPPKTSLFIVIRDEQ